MAEQVHSLGELRDNPLRAFNQTEARAANAVLKEIAGQEPVVAEMLKDGGALKEFLTAALSLSPYVRESLSIRPAMLARYLSAPVEQLLAQSVEAARQSWEPRSDGSMPTEAEVMTALRNAKREVSVLLALADLARW